MAMEWLRSMVEVRRAIVHGMERGMKRGVRDV